MNALALIQLIVTLLSGVLAAATSNKLPQEIIAGVQAAITALESVHGSDVTKAQLESLRVTPQW